MQFYRELGKKNIWIYRHSNVEEIKTFGKTSCKKEVKHNKNAQLIKNWKQEL